MEQAKQAFQADKCSVLGEEEEVEQAKQAVQADNIQFQVRRKRWSRPNRQFRQTIFSSR